MEIDNTKKVPTQMRIREDAFNIAMELAEFYGVSKARVVETMLLSYGPALLKDLRKEAGIHAD